MKIVRKNILPAIAICTAAFMITGELYIGLDKMRSESAVASVKEPEEVTEKESEPDSWPVLVIDAGHGGFDGGAQAKDGTDEKSINLEISKELEDIASKYELRVVMTRAGDTALCGENSNSPKSDDLKARRQIMEQEGVILAVSIHLNSYPQDESVYGAQVFYPPQGESKEIAENVQKTMEEMIDDGRKREAMCKDDVLLLKNPTYPIILVECGFLSNSSEAEKLKDEAYQRLLAEAIWQGINEKLCIERRNTIRIVDNSKDNFLQKNG